MIAAGRITAMEAVADPQRLGQLEISAFEN
jgi:hypothetical protein